LPKNVEKKEKGCVLFALLVNKKKTKKRRK